MDPVNVLAKFEIRCFPVPEIIGGTQKIWSVSGYAHAPFSPKFFMGFCSDGWTLLLFWPNLKFVALQYNTIQYNEGI